MSLKQAEAEALTAGQTAWQRWKPYVVSFAIGFLLGAIGIGIANAAPPVQTFTRTAGPGAGQQTISWNVTGAVSCAASATPSNSGWTGSKPASGTAIVSMATSDQLVLVCSTAGDSGAVVLWTAPTKNTDGSNLTDLAGFTLYTGQNAAALIKQGTYAPGVLSATLTGLAPGAWFFALDAFNSTNDHSAMTGNVTKTTTAVESATSTLKVTVPLPPTGVTAN